jgi:hypothetical protein
MSGFKRTGTRVKHAEDDEDFDSLHVGHDISEPPSKLVQTSERQHLHAYVTVCEKGTL